MSNDGSPNLKRVRVDQVGSLLRPATLKETYARHGRREASDEELGRAQDKAIRAIIARQERLDLPVVTDGEFRRLNFQDSFGESVAGFAPENRSIQFHERRAAGATAFSRWDRDNPDGDTSLFYWRPITSSLKLERNRPLEEYLAAQALTARPVKITLISPDRICEQFERRNSASVYRDIDEFIADVARIERQMVAALVEKGCRYVQIDAPSYTSYVDPPSLERMRRRGEDPTAIMERSIRADNAVIAGFDEVAFGVHFCRGNQRSMWHREGSYDAIAEKLFNTLDHHRLLLEYDSERAGGFEPLRFVPKGKVAVLGLVSSKVSRVESADELMRRIDEAGRYIAVEQLALSPQCGFASNILGNLLSEEAQWRKFEVIQEVAARVWPDR